MTEVVPTRLIGRTAELCLLRDALQQAAGGQPRVVLVRGEAGIGKTRLLQEFTAEAVADDALVLAGGCGERSAGNLPYAPLVGALRGLREHPDWPRLREQLQPWLPPLGRLVPALAEGLPPEPDLGQPRLFEFVLAVLASLAHRAPVVLVLEDLHWTDQSSLDLLSFLLRNLRGERLLLVLTYRSDELARSHELRPTLAELARDRRVKAVDLAPFDRDELASLAAGALAGQAPPCLVDRLVERSDGNPFFAEELLAAGAAGVDDPPEQLRDVVLSRVHRLGDDTHTVLSVAAVAGRQVDEPILARVCGLTGSRLRDALREAVAHRVLLDDAAARTYRFRHWLAQNAIYFDLLHGERQDLHAGLAAALQEGLDHEGLGPEPDPALAAEIAHHWVAAARPREAFVASVRAGQAAINALAYTEALSHLECAHRIAPTVPDAEPAAGLRPGELLELLAEAARWTGDISRAVGLTRQALAQLDPERDRLRAGLLYDFLGHCLWEDGDSDGSLHAYRCASELLPPDAPGLARARAMAGEATALMLNSRYQESKARAGEALDLAREVGAVREQSRALCTLGVDMSMLGDLPGAIALLGESLELAERIDNLEEVCRAYTNLASVLELAGRLEEAARIGLEGFERSRRHGLELTGGGVLAGNTASALLRLGRWDDAERILDEMLPGLTGMMRAHVVQLRATLLLGRGRLEEAESELKTARELAAQVTEAQLIGPLHAARAELATLTHRPHEALTAVEEGIAAVVDSEDKHLVVRLCALGVRALANLAERIKLGLETEQPRPALVEPGDTWSTAARRIADTARACVEELTKRGAAVPEAEADLAECQAELGRLVSGNRPRDWDPAIARWVELGQPYRAAYVRYRKAEAMAVAKGRATRKGAGDLLREVRAKARELGAATLVRDAEQLAESLGVDLTEVAPEAAAMPDVPPTPAQRLRLTPRELQVLRFVARGLLNKEIARLLSEVSGGRTVTENTVAVHVSNLMRKLGAANRTEAAVKAYRLGVIEHPPES